MLIDFLIAVIAPLFIPLFYHTLSGITVPTVTRTSSLQKIDYQKNVPIFLKELPTAYIGNAIWGMTYKFSSGINITNWTIVYCFIALFSCMPILWSRKIKKPVLYQISTITIYIILCTLSIIRIFNITQ